MCDMKAMNLSILIFMFWITAIHSNEFVNHHDMFPKEADVKGSDDKYASSFTSFGPPNYHDAKTTTLDPAENMQSLDPLDSTQSFNSVHKAPSCSQRYENNYRILVRFLWNHIEPVLEKSTQRQGQILAYLNPSDKLNVVITRFLNNRSDNLEEVTSLLTDMVTKVTSDATESFSDYSWWLLGPFGYSGYIVVLASCVAMFYFSRWIYHLGQLNMLTIITFFFVISVPWSWYRLYRVKIAEQQHRMMAGIPSHCRPDHTRTWLSSVVGYLWTPFRNSLKDECDGYLRNMWSDPFWEVNPLDAVVETVAGVLRFARPIGDAIGLLYRGVNDHVPFFFVPLLLTPFGLVGMLVIAMLKGYSFRIPFIFHMESQRNIAHNVGPAVTSSQEVREALRSLSLRERQDVLAEFIDHRPQVGPAGDMRMGGTGLQVEGSPGVHRPMVLPVSPPTHRSNTSPLSRRNRKSWKECQNRTSGLPTVLENGNNL